ncbi:hypothetical protein FALCPG4_003936 [Fusarium falciforme]
MSSIDAKGDKEVSKRVLALRPPLKAFISTASPVDDGKQPNTTSKEPKQTLLCASCGRPQFLDKDTGRIPVDTSAALNNKDQLQGSCCLGIMQPAQATSRHFERNCLKQDRATRSDNWSIFCVVDEQRASASLPKKP